MPSSPTRPPAVYRPQSTASYLAYPVAHVVSGIYRRLVDPASAPQTPSATRSSTRNPTRNSSMQSLSASIIDPPPRGGVFQATHHRRTVSPFQPPSLTGLSLRGVHASTSQSARILTRALAEEIRLLFPPRLQLVTDWTLAYSIHQDGASLSTLFEKCAAHAAARQGFVVAVRDTAGGIFGAYLSDAPHPSAHYYGTGECFLWRASVLPVAAVLSSLPPPPSADTTALVGRSTTIASANGRSSSAPHRRKSPGGLLSPGATPPVQQDGGDGRPASGASTPDRIRFKAFPYSGVNDYLIFCEHGYLSVGGGDGRYGLWLDGGLEEGVSAHCMTFGNEALSDEGERFDVLAVEVWYVGTD